MNITYTCNRYYTEEQLEELFLSVEWLSGKYPKRLLKALDNCATVITAWDDNKLVGLINALDDGEITAYVHYLLVHPDYQGYGISKELLKQVKDKYKDFLHLFLIAETPKLIKYYKKAEFKHMTDASVMAVNQM